MHDINAMSGITSSQADRLRVRIEEEILSFKLRPGDRLDEARLAEKYGTSRTPVREALRQLSSNGLIEIRPHKGAIVSKIGLRELAELFEVMAELEGACGRLAAKAGIKSDIETILKAHEDCRRAAELNDIAGYQRANEAFHDAICHASRNACLIKLTMSIRNRVAPFRRMQIEGRDRAGKYFHEHEAIIRAIESANPDEADRLLQAHLANYDTRQLISMVSGANLDTLTRERSDIQLARKIATRESVAVK